jgi:hypothetical protein
MEESAIELGNCATKPKFCSNLKIFISLMIFSRGVNGRIESLGLDALKFE